MRIQRNSDAGAERTYALACYMYMVVSVGPPFLPHHRDLFPTVHLDRGYDSGKTRDLLDILGFHGEIAVKGVPAPIQAGRRWPVERTTWTTAAVILAADVLCGATPGGDIFR